MDGFSSQCVFILPYGKIFKMFGIYRFMYPLGNFLGVKLAINTYLLPLYNSESLCYYNATEGETQSGTG